VNNDHVAHRLVRFAAGLDGGSLPVAVRDKAKLCLLDFVGCALEAGTLPWGRQAASYALSQGGTAATVIGESGRSSSAEAAFANGMIGHGLVREDMHTPSSSHLGVVIWPTLLALSETSDASGSDLLAAAASGYEAGGRIGRMLIDREIARHFRPTSMVGPIGAALAGARLLRLHEDSAISAVGLAANTAGGLNEWPRTGGTEVFFHAGIAARNAVTSVELARLGTLASATAVDGPAGLFAAFGRGEKSAAVEPLADGTFEILNVYLKPAPACNFVQTPCQATLRLCRREKIDAREVRAVLVRTFPEAATYPGCDYAGPFDSILPAKMSIQYSVAAVIVNCAIDEVNYTLLSDPQVQRLARATRLELDDEFTAGFPERQGAEIQLDLADGRRVSERLEALVPSSPQEVRARFRKAGVAVWGAAKADRIGEMVDGLERLDRAGRLAAELGGPEGIRIQSPRSASQPAESAITGR
jgi:2-methylcitrate dehydratase PrpD